MRSLSRFHVSRAFGPIALGALLAVTGSLRWMAVLVGVIALAFLLSAPRSGRYTVHPERGVTALR